MLGSMSSPDRDIVETVRHPLVRAAIALLVLAALATAALGGFGKASSQRSYPVIGVGRQASSGALRIAPLCAWVTRTRPGSAFEATDKGYLVLRVRAENLTARDGALYLGKDVVWLPDGRSGEKPASFTLRADDHSFHVQLQPRLPGVADLVWELPPAASLRQPVTWGLYQRRYEPRTPLSGEAMWVQDGPGSKLVLQARERCIEGGQA